MIETIFLWIGFICCSLIAIISTIFLCAMFIWLGILLITGPMYDKLNGLGKAHIILDYLRENKESWDKFRGNKVVLPIIDEKEADE